MKKVLFLLIALTLVVGKLKATDFDGEKLLSLINISADSATQVHVTAILGQPERVTSSRNKTYWHYSNDKTDMVISWSSKTGTFQRFSCKYLTADKQNIENKNPIKLKSGTTCINQAFSILGVPKDMVVKKKTMELHYTYQHKKLRLFFRDQILVDYCLY